MDYEVYLLYEGEPPAGAGEIVPLPRPLVDAALEQTRDWADAARAAKAATSAVKLSDPLPSAERLEPFCERVLEAATRHPPRAILWTPAQRLVSRELLAQALADDTVARIAVNVRLFHVEDGAPGETVLDTMGLTILGLPDVQCHFVDLPPADVAPVLFVVACYLLDEGGVIDEGDTVPGPNDEDWLCHVEEALVDPPRDVIDLEPPGSHAARRKR